MPPDRCPFETLGIRLRILVFVERYRRGHLRAGVKPPVAGLSVPGCCFHPVTETVSVTFEDR